ncbi:MAG: DAK2 domain-containing protein [Planctomycetaceae bacterium]|jgi:dihydroxyacetone kinase-like protein|nr:DAK2 domain-containing protein [Planctomycetaceae bacterium]
MKFTKTLLQKMLDSALAAIEANLSYLNQLDSATGDGDHGTAILAAMKAAVAAKKDGTLAAAFETIGWDIMSSTSGSTSALTGSFFAGMSAAATVEEPNVSQTAALFEAGLANLKTATKANTGDKTLMDALIPAVEAMTAYKKTAENTASLAELFRRAAEAAQKGAESTKDLAAKHGRAKNLGERSKGNLDAGAISTALIYKAYYDAIND